MKVGFLTCASAGSYGRFGNAAYQRAAMLGIARRNNLEPVFGPFLNLDHRDRFGSAEDIDLDKYFVHLIPQPPEGIQWQPEIQVGWGFHDIRLRPGNWNLSGHFQSPKYFNEVMDTVRHYMTMHDEPPQNDYAGCHVRLGDYCGNYHPRLNMDYYGPAMAQFPANQRFLVFSDDIDSAKAMFGNGPNFDYSEGRDYIQDFKLLKRCRHFIVGNSSYSAFAATIADAPDKKVVAPRPWFGKGYAQIDGEDIYEPSWSVINWQ